MSGKDGVEQHRKQPKDVASLVSRTLSVDGRIIHVRLEPSYWEGLDEICHREDLSVDELCADVQDRMEQQSRRVGGQGSVSLANALRVFVVGYYRQAATERGHNRAGHGQGDPFASTPFADTPFDRSASLYDV